MPLNVVMKQNVVIFISYKLNLLLLHKTKRLEHLMVMRTDSNAQKLQTDVSSYYKISSVQWFQ